MGKKRGGRGGRGGGEGRGEVEEGEEMEEEEDDEEEFTVSTFVRLEQRGSKFLSFTKEKHSIYCNSMLASLMRPKSLAKLPVLH